MKADFFKTGGIDALDQCMRTGVVFHDTFTVSGINALDQCMRLPYSLTFSYFLSIIFQRMPHFRAFKMAEDVKRQQTFLSCCRLWFIS